MKKSLAILGLVVLWSLSTSANAMTLQESINYAVNNNPSIATIKKKAEAAGAKVSQARGAFLPTFKLDGNYGDAYSQPSTVQITTQTTAGAVTQTFTFGTDATSMNKGWTASLSQPIFVPALLPGYQIAQSGADTASQDLRRVVQDTVYNTTVAYFGVLASDRFVQVNKDALDVAKGHLGLVEKMQNNGVATRSDQLRADVAVANAEVALTKSENLAQTSKNSFNNVLGLSLNTPVSLEEKLTDPIKQMPELQLLIETAFDQRPEWKQFLLSKEIAEENVGLAKTAFLPNILLSGQTSNRVVQYPTYKSDVNSWTVAGAASWTIFEGLTTYNRVREAELNLASQTANQEQVKNNIELEVTDAYLNLKTCLDTITYTKKAVEFAKESLDVSNQRYLAGVINNLEVVDAQVALTQARTNYLKSLFDLEVAKARVNRVVGKEMF